MAPRLLALLLAATQVACSFSYSSGSLSDSVQSSSHSLGSSSDSVSSSSPGGAERAYQADVRDYTRTFAAAGPRADLTAFRSDLARLAERHGITDWESNLATYVAIGEGLGLAKVNEAELMAYQQTLGGDDLSKREAIRRGYDARR